MDFFFFSELLLQLNGVNQQQKWQFNEQTRVNAMSLLSPIPESSFRADLMAP